MTIKNLKIVTLDKVINNGFIEINNDLITNVGEGEYKGEAIDAKGLIAMPGFIDIHTHGALGYDYMSASKEEMVKIANALYEEGVTSILATTLTSDMDSLSKACSTIYEAMQLTPSIKGIHLEGPFISLEYKGAQNPEYIQAPSKDSLDALIKASHDNVRDITLASELNGSLDFIKYARSKNVTVSLGHSNATFDDAVKGFEAGATNLTHAHNAMTGYHHRKPGLLEASMLYKDNVYAELICDTIHVCPNTLKTYFNIMGSDHFMIITDSLCVKRSDVKEFDLFGLPCENREVAAYLAHSDTLAGSVLRFDQGVRNVKNITNCSLVDLMKISSFNQAKSLHLNNIGLIAKGYKADIVLLDNELNVRRTYQDGILKFER